MAVRIEDLVASQKRLVSDMSHELRSPLARLRVALELARNKSGAGPELDRIERETERMTEMIGQLLGLASLENAGELVGEGDQRREFSLDRLLEEVVSDAHFEADGQGKDVSLVTTHECLFTGYPDLIRSALENIIRNGVRYTADETGVEVSLECTHGEQEARQTSITIRDHGPGVPAKALKDLFRPFYRVEDARDRQSGGAGLGLAIADRIIRLHGGVVSARNIPGGGLQVMVGLPSGPPSDYDIPR